MPAKGLSADAAQAYERVRADVLAGQARPEALGTFAFHGMWQGLRVLSKTTSTPSQLPTMPPALPAVSASALDRQLVRLLADMVLATQLEVHHAH